MIKINNAIDQTIIIKRIPEGASAQAQKELQPKEGTDHGS